jgi:transcriptional regulator with XRE-family HTH domain
LENTHLRTAITGSGLTLEEFADIVQVDVKTVQRWLAGRTPYPRLRSRAAGALDTTEHALWPDAVPAPTAPDAPEPTARPPGDMITGYAHATNPGAPSVAELVNAAVERAEIVIPDLASQPGLAELLRERGADGCLVRIIIEDPDERVEALFGIDAIEVRASPAGEDHVLYRSDEQILLVLRRLSSSGESPPVIHLRRLVDGGLFDRLADDFEDRWPQATRLASREQLHAYLADTELEPWTEPHQPPAAKPPPPTAPTRPPVTPAASPADAPRRWPRRPA